MVEGRRELLRCVEAGYVVETIFFCPELVADGLIPRIAAGAVVAVSPAVYGRIAYRGGTEGIVAIVKARQLRLEGIRNEKVGIRVSPTSSPNPLIVVVEGVEKPGNLGAVLRSADAAGADAVIVCDPLTDLYNPNLIRSSIGAVFTVPTVVCSSEECIAWLKGSGIRILTAQLQDSSLYYESEMTGPTAIVMGTEATGLSNVWREAADAHIRIPMLGRLDSLNVSVSAAILLFEAVRQRSYDLRANGCANYESCPDMEPCAGLC